MKKKENISAESWIARMSNKVKFGGGINLAQGMPGFNPPDQLLRDLNELCFKPVHQYPPGNGHPELLSQICESYKGVAQIDPDEALIVQGATEGVSLVYTYMMHRFGNSWSSLAFDPVYESYNQLPKVFNMGQVKVPFKEGGEIDKTFIEKQIVEHAVKLIFVNSPGNPYGKIWTKAEFDWLFELADKYDFFILLDAVYKDMYFGKSIPYQPFAIKRDRLFYINSFSKMLSITGWRVGYLITEKSIMSEIRAIHDYTGLCAPSILQYAISDYLAKSNYAEEYIEVIRNKLSENYLFMTNELEQLGFSVEQSGGGYFIWCRLPENLDNGLDFSLNLYDKQKVAVVPGIHFSSESKYWIRINIAREKKELVQAVFRIGKYIKNKADNQS